MRVFVGCDDVLLVFCDVGGFVGGVFYGCYGLFYLVLYLLAGTLCFHRLLWCGFVLCCLWFYCWCLYFVLLY